jgi:hypothetical protein
MIYELRTYALKHRTLPDVVKAASTVSLDVRRDDYDKLEGYWQTEIGPLNQVMHLWSYQDLNQRRTCVPSSARTRTGMRSTSR